jgi:hypothetical protein
MMEATFEPTTLTVPRPPDGGDGRLGDVPILPLSQLPSEETPPRNGMRRPCEGTCRVARGLARSPMLIPFFEGLSRPNRLEVTQDRPRPVPLRSRWQVDRLR